MTFCLRSFFRKSFLDQQSNALCFFGFFLIRGFAGGLFQGFFFLLVVNRMPLSYTVVAVVVIS